jgi:hypothetical protein
MTDFLESVRPMEPVPLADAALPGSPLAESALAGPALGGPALGDPAQPSVRQLLTELAHLEDVVRAGGRLDGPLDQAAADAAVVAAMAREQAILDELHRRGTAQAGKPPG